MPITTFPQPAVSMQPSAAASPLDAIVHEAGRKLQTLRMHRIVGAGDHRDAAAVNADLTALAKIFDGVIRDVGLYAHSHIGISSKVVDEYFTDIVLNNLEGWGMFEVEAAGKQATAYLRGEPVE